MSPLLGRHLPDDLVALGERGPRTARELLADAGTLAAALPPAAPGAHALLVFERDRYAFAAALLAAWARGYAVALPPNHRVQTLTALMQRAEVAKVLHDTDAGGDLQVHRRLAGPAAAPLLEPTVPAGLAATVFTSGTTGSSEAWTKTGAQLLDEVEVLVRTFAIARGSRAAVTVPPHHLYGLLFGVLMPLCAGAAFVRETPLLPEAVASQVEAVAADVLVSVPVHLRAVQAVASGRLASLRRVFSSTAPLDEDTARAFARAHARPITEIFGSTETGGIAWRERDRDEAWQPLLGVTVSIDDEGYLRVDSPWLPSDCERPWVTADLADRGPSGSFVLRGRADGVVKVGGLRVSLPQLQQWLLAQPGVEDAEVISVPAPGRGLRILAAVVAKSRDEASLRAAMLESFAPAAVPRRLLLVDGLPREPTGKLPRHALLSLFGLRADGSPPSTALELDAPHPEPDEGAAAFTAHVRVPADYVHFEGHFEGYPVMAAVVQLHELLLPLVEQARPGLGPLQELLRLKFLGQIVPGDELRVTLRFPLDAHAEARAAIDCDFEISNRRGRCSAGRLRFGAAP